MPNTPVTISAAVEGAADEAVARRLIAHVGAQPGPVYGKNGKAQLRERIAAYNNAARHAPWIVLVDLDSDAECAPPLRTAWVPVPARRLCFRVAVRAVESWLLADAEAIADFLGVARRRIPVDPERLEGPKESLVNIARKSRRRAIREDMVPRAESGRPVGPAYASRLVEFASSLWHPDRAARQADSLRRAIECLTSLTRPQQIDSSARNRR